MQPSINFGFPDFQFNFEFSCEIHHCFPRAVPDSTNFRVLIHTAEPTPLKWSSTEVRKYHSNFDLIITSDESLNDLPNTEFMIFGDNWVSKMPKQKKFSISYLHSVGVKADWDGYILRDEIWRERNRLTSPAKFDFWYSNRRPPCISQIEKTDQSYPDDDKDLVYESMFSLCIENIREKNYFTEKLIDPLSTATIPIYYGCNNISDFFDLNGIIIINNLSELSEIVKQLTPDFYWEKLSALQKNMELARKYHFGFSRVREIIEKRYHEKKLFKNG